MRWHTNILKTLDYYTEGPCLDPEGNIYFTSLTGGAVYKMSPVGDCEQWATAVCPNGQLILPNGDHLVCDSQRAAILRFSKKGVFLGFVCDRECAGFSVQVPNDITADQWGNLFFTDSVRQTGSLYMISHTGEQVRLLTGLDYPNGLAFSPNGKMLYLAESYRNRILCLDTGQLISGVPNREQYIQLPVHASGSAENNLPDGLAVNETGMLAVAHYGMQAVQLYAPDGQWLGAIETPFTCVSNLCFLNSDSLIVSGGYAEPGPGAIVQITFSID